MTENKSFSWKRLIGNFDGLASLLGLFFVLNFNSGANYWLMVILFSLTIGLGIGAMRFGNMLFKICGIISAGGLSYFLLVATLLKLARLI